jgi:hypothetical protein
MSATQAGVQDAWDFWLSQHPVSVSEMIEDAVRAAVTAWLDEHSDAILAMFQRRAETAADEVSPAAAVLPANGGAR